MENVKFEGRIISTIEGSESSLIIPVGDFRIMIFSDDCNGIGKGKLLRNEILVYHKENSPSQNINKKIFGYDFATADTESLLEAMRYCEQQLRKSI